MENQHHHHHYPEAPLRIEIIHTICYEGFPVELKALLEKISSGISQIKTTLKTMSQAIDDLKAKVQSQTDALDAISTSVTGVATDQQFLKDKIQTLIDGGNGANPQELTELGNMVDAQGAKITALGQTLSDLDASTDSTATP